MKVLYWVNCFIPKPRTRLWFRVLGVLMCGAWPYLASGQSGGDFPHLFVSASYGFYARSQGNLPPYQAQSLRATAGIYRSARWALASVFQYHWRDEGGLPLPGTYQIGLVAQRLTPLRRRWQMYVEGGVHQGNYCTCEGDQKNPFRQPGLLYGSTGAGLQRRLFPHVWLEAGYTYHLILTRRALIAPLYGVQYGYIGLHIREWDRQR
ncbi:MAG: hypothetical protein D6722_20770 [Bacteroidetes bacterium]|nr:MAG: hypothetical protein D6722_20770 [Bacteroidota bacterium]